jgi:cobalt-zinc-cadmium efflux system outer membrane protein
MRKRVRAVVPILVTLAISAADRRQVDAQTPAASVVPQDSAHQHADERRQYDGPPLSMPAALDEALARNPDLLALRAQLPVVRTRPAQERALMPPMVEGTVWQWPINTLNPANTNMYMFMLGQELPGRGKRDLRAAVAEKDVALAESDVTIRERQVLNAVRQAYASLFIARKAIDLHLTNVDLLRQIADVAEAKYAAGRNSQQDVLKSVVELSTLHNDILLFDEQANVAAARLNALLDRAPDTPIGPLIDPGEQALLPTPSGLQRLAIDRQPELQRARLEIERADAELASAKREYTPDFTVQGGYLLMPNQIDALLARVGVTWPRAPWSHGKVDAHVAEQTAAVEAAKARERGMESSVRLAVQEAYVHAQSAQDRAALLRTTILPQAQQKLDVSRIAYQADRGDVQALLESERMLLDTQLDYFRALSDFNQATSDLERAIGTDLPAGTLTAIPSSEGK